MCHAVVDSWPRVVLCVGGLIVATVASAAAEPADSAGIDVRAAYGRARADRGDTAKDHFALATWCREHGLADQARDHLRAVIERDPGFAPAFRELGYVRVGPAWLDVQRRRPQPVTPTTQPSNPTTGPDRSDPDPAAARAAARADLQRELITDWVIRVKSIRKTYLEPGETLRRERSWAQGRKRILAIRDPMALPALTRVLSAGGRAQRRLLVESLAGFEQDSATMNLLALTLIDADPQVREAATLELLTRSDKRIEDQLRSALHSDEETIIRRAGSALGLMKSRAAIPDLIAALRADRRVTVRVPVRRLWTGLRTAYSTGSGVIVPGSGPVIGVVAAGRPFYPTWTRSHRTLTIYRTEVLEALAAITGQRLGFDVEAWRRWVRLNPQAVDGRPP